MSYRVDCFVGREDEARLEAVQRLRYDVYHAELGFDPPGMDHEAGRDRTKHDRRARLFCVWFDDALVGTLRLQESGAIALSAEDEFELSPSPSVVEGARYAVRREHRNGPAPLLLFDAFRRWCRAHSIETVLSIVMLPDASRDPEIPRAALAWAARRVQFDWTFARPRPEYVYGTFEEPPSARDVEPPVLPPMLKMLASSRTTSCSAPAYCADYRAWSLLFATDLSGGAR